MAKKVLRKKVEKFSSNDSATQKKPNNTPIYILAAAIIIILTLFGIGFYYTIKNTPLPKIDPWIIGAIIFILFASIIFEITTKSGIYLMRRDGDQIDNPEPNNIEKNESKDPNPPDKIEGRTGDK